MLTRKNAPNFTRLKPDIGRGDFPFPSPAKWQNGENGEMKHSGQDFEMSKDVNSGGGGSGEYKDAIGKKSAP